MEWPAEQVVPKGMECKYYLKTGTIFIRAASYTKDMITKFAADGGKAPKPFYHILFFVTAGAREGPNWITINKAFQIIFHSHLQPRISDDNGNESTCNGEQVSVVRTAKMMVTTIRATMTSTLFETCHDDNHIDVTLSFIIGSACCSTVSVGTAFASVQIWLCSYACCSAYLNIYV